MRFDDLTKPCVRLAKHVFDIEFREKSKPPKWTGPKEQGRFTAAGSLSPQETIRSMYDPDAQYSPLEQLMALAIQLGIEQGRRLMIEKLNETHRLLCCALAIKNTQLTMDAMERFTEQLRA